MLLLSLAAALVLAANAPAAEPAGGSTAAEPAAQPAMVKKRVCQKVDTTDSRTARRVCKTVMVPAEPGATAKTEDAQQETSPQSGTGGS